MRIAFLNRGRDVYPGGDVIALDATMNALRKRGVECIETGWDVDRLRGESFDLAHIFHCNFSWSWGNFEAVALKAKLPYVLTPIYYPGLLAGISRSQITELLTTAKYILPFSRLEQDEIRADWFPTRNSKWEIIPNGTGLEFHYSKLEEPLVGRHGVLCVAARHGDKNVDLVAGLCAELGFEFRCATDIEHSKLPAIYKRYRVFVNASGSERMSLTVGEALCAGCRVLSSQGNRGNEHYPGLVTFQTMGEGHRRTLKTLIKEAYMRADWDWRPNEAARKLTWDAVAVDLESVYKVVLGVGAGA